ncbi:MAG: hypothetical protein GWN13_05975, partial [Phycisphaerae bacterium]|nr:hypothetical protein [Phycisphaerae bacterium]
MSLRDKISLSDVITSDTYTIWVRGCPTNAAGDSLYVALDGQIVNLTDVEPGDWGWTNQFQAGGPIELNITQPALDQRIPTNSQANPPTNSPPWPAPSTTAVTTS